MMKRSKAGHRKFVPGTTFSENDPQEAATTETAEVDTVHEPATNETANNTAAETELFRQPPTKKLMPRKLLKPKHHTPMMGVVPGENSLQTNSMTI
jgi:hypothetical protein